MEKENEPPKNDLEKIDDINNEINNNLKQEVKNEKLNEKMDIDEINTENNKDDNKINENENIENEKDNNNNNIEIKDEKNHKKEKNSLMRFPLAKIKNIIKLDDDIKLCQKNAYFVIGKLTELFLQELAKNSYLVCKNQKRKTINIEDINTAIRQSDKYSFIDINSIFYIENLKSSKKQNKRKKDENNLSINNFLNDCEDINKNTNKNNDKEDEKKNDNILNIKNNNKEIKKSSLKNTNKKKNIIPNNNMTLDNMFFKK